MGEVIRRSMIGVAYGGLTTFIALTILLVQDITPTIQQVWMNMLLAFLLGIYFGLSSFIFEIDGWSPLKMTVIHFFLSISIYFVIALSVGWVPVEWQAIGLSFLIFTVLYAIYWYGFWAYHKRLEVKMNEHLWKK